MFVEGAIGYVDVKDSNTEFARPVPRKQVQSWRGKGWVDDVGDRTTGSSSGLGVCTQASGDHGVLPTKHFMRTRTCEYVPMKVSLACQIGPMKVTLGEDGCLCGAMVVYHAQHIPIDQWRAL